MPGVRGLHCLTAPSVLLAHGGASCPERKMAFLHMPAVCRKARAACIAVRLRSNKKVQNLSKMCYKFFRQPLVAQGDFGHEFS